MLDYAESGGPIAAPLARRDIAIHRSRLLRQNGERADRWVAALRLATALVILEIVAWVVDLALA